MCFDRNINGNRDVKFLIGINGHCTDERNLTISSIKLYLIKILQLLFALEVSQLNPKFQTSGILFKGLIHLLMR